MSDIKQPNDGDRELLERIVRLHIPADEWDDTVPIAVRPNDVMAEPERDSPRRVSDGRGCPAEPSRNDLAGRFAADVQSAASGQPWRRA